VGGEATAEHSVGSGGGGGGCRGEEPAAPHAAAAFGSV